MLFTQMIFANISKDAGDVSTTYGCHGRASGEMCAAEHLLAPPVVNLGNEIGKLDWRGSSCDPVIVTVQMSARQSAAIPAPRQHVIQGQYRD